MIKKDLKNGALVELRNGEQCILKDNALHLLEIHPYYILNDFNDNLTYKGDKDIDIVKIDNSNHLYFDTKWTWKRKDILTDKERAYLKAVIEPVKDKVKNIKKRTYVSSQNSSIYIELEGEYDYISLYPFEENTQFKGMKLNKHYTLEELGLE